MDQHSEESFRDFVATWSPGLMRTAFLLTGDHGHAEDLVQSALLKTARHWSRLADPQAAYGYVRRVVVNTHTSSLRRHRVSERLSDRIPESLPGAHDHFAPADRTAAALAALPAGMRAVLVLRFFEDLSEAETARTLGCSVGNVKSQASRGLERMRRELAASDVGTDAGSPAVLSTPKGPR